ncbi:MAG: hypothetical protein U0359_42065 [Byssovorax sp.]
MRMIKPVRDLGGGGAGRGTPMLRWVVVMAEGTRGAGATGWPVKPAPYGDEGTSAEMGPEV